MRRLSNAIFLAGFLPLPCVAVEMTPHALLGKSITVSWSENRVQRALPDDVFHEVHLERHAEVYLAPSGRVFKRESVVDDGQRMFRGRGATRSNSSDQVVDGESGRQVGVSFARNTLIVTTLAERGARQMVVSFADGFGSCQAKIINGRESGSSTYVVRSMTTGYDIEIKSGTIGPSTCAVLDGNVFR